MKMSASEIPVEQTERLLQLEPGTKACLLKTAGSQRWAENSEYLEEHRQVHRG